MAVGALSLSLAGHLAVLTWAGGAGGPRAPQQAAPTVSVALLAPPAAAPAAPAASVATAPAAQPAPRPPPRPAARPRPRVAPAPKATPAQPPAAAPATAAAAAVPADPFLAQAEALRQAEAMPPDDAMQDASTGAAAATATAPAQPGQASGAPPASARERPGETPAQVALAAPAQAASAPPSDPPVRVAPQSGSALYRVHYGDPADGNVVATMSESFELGPEGYRLRSEGRAQGVVSWFWRGTLVQESIGAVTDEGLAPSTYRERRGERAPREVSIDAGRGEVLFSSGVREVAPPGLQDRLSILVQLALLRHARPAMFAPGSEIVLPVLASSKVAAATWRVLGEELVDTGDGPQPALRLSRAASGADDPAVDVWLALDARVLPLRLRIAEANGRALDQVLQTR
ncbi:MAG: hypothetical protein BGO72_16960 [Burkholderiales bacterium 70-64]|nr:MAG: hypothetical protein BGO72_16960 [Burkholderiales bacterium 70-64]